MTVLWNARFKLDRGNAQLEALYRKLTEALDSKEDGFEAALHKEPHPKPHLYDPRPWTSVVLYIKNVPTLDTEFGLLMGEALHNFRGALDHAIWQIVNRGRSKRLVAGEARRIQFTMRPNRDEFTRAAKRELLDADPTIVALVERYQPYKRSDAGRDIRRLQKVTNTDKHRVVIPTPSFTHMGQVDFKLIPRPGSEVELVRRLPQNMQIKAGTEIAKWIFKGWRPDQLKVPMKTSIAWGFSLPRSVANPAGDEVMELHTILSRISATCWQIMDELESLV
jgi:hypothetical protein